MRVPGSNLQSQASDPEPVDRCVGMVTRKYAANVRRSATVTQLNIPSLGSEPWTPWYLCGQHDKLHNAIAEAGNLLRGSRAGDCTDELRP
jgi:hypothetical protein